MQELSDLVCTWTSNSEDADAWISELYKERICTVVQLKRCAEYEDLWNMLCNRVSMALCAELRNWKENSQRIKGFDDLVSRILLFRD